MIKRNGKIFFSLVIVCLLAQIVFPFKSYAKERAYDIRTEECSSTMNFSKTMISIDPAIAAESAPESISTVNFSVTLTGYLHYDAITGRYVSASSPVATLNYQGVVALKWQSFSTSYRDNGDTVTFSFNGKLTGSHVSNMGVYCTMDYGDVSGSFTVDKY